MIETGGIDSKERERYREREIEMIEIEETDDRGDDMEMIKIPKIGQIKMIETNYLFFSSPEYILFLHRKFIFLDYLFTMRTKFDYL